MQQDNFELEDQRFRLEIARGTSFKALLALLASCSLANDLFIVNKNGIFYSNSDESRYICVRCDFLRAEFQKFYYGDEENDIKIGLDVSLVNKNVTSVKVKDNVILRIDKNDPNKLIITVRSPENILSTYGAPVQKISKNPVLPMEEIKGLKLYEENINIKASVFAVVIKNLVQSKCPLEITIQGGEYIKFMSGITYDSIIEQGCFNKNKPYYKGTFLSHLFISLSKLPTLGKTISFFPPTKKYYPLKINVKAESLGSISVYVKDEELAAKEGLKNPGILVRKKGAHSQAQ